MCAIRTIIKTIFAIFDCLYVTRSSGFFIFSPFHTANLLKTVGQVLFLLIKRIDLFPITIIYYTKMAAKINQYCGRSSQTKQILPGLKKELFLTSSKVTFMNSLFYRRSMRSTNSRVLSLSKAQWPITSMMRQESVLPVRLAAAKRSRSY